MLALIWIFASISGSAQTSGRIEGKVKNAAGAALSNVTVLVRSLQTGETRTIQTNPEGSFSARELSPGRYELKASLPGFSPFTATAMVEAGVIRRINVVLQREGANADTGDSSTGGSVSSKTVRDLPSNGRDWTQAATLQAGVEAVRTQPDASNTNSGRGQRGFGAQISISGGRPQQNNYVVDGISINDYANAAPGILGESGCDAWTLARIAGHSSVAMSARYVHPSEDAVLAALDRLSGHNFGHSGNTSKKTLAVEPPLSASND